MRFKLQLELENEYLPIQYRKNILSFIKKSLSEYDIKYFNNIYHEKDNNIKPFTFAVFMEKPIFEKENIKIENKCFNIYMSFEDINMSLMFYNGLNNQLNKKFSIDKNSWCLKKITMIPEKNIINESITIKFMSPLVVRSRENEKDYYYSSNDSQFERTLKINIKNQLQKSTIPPELVEDFKIEPINARKTVVKFYEKQIECSIGTYKLYGNINLLEYLYKSGMGSKHSSGFGMFEIM